MKKTLMTLAIAILCLGCTSASSRQPARTGEATTDTASVTTDTTKAAAGTDNATVGIADGCLAPDFTLNDISGKPLTLSSLRGKYLILDFWGSWCIWCIRGMPEMKRYYEKYSDRLEILGIDCSDTDQKWKDAVKANGLPWKHVYNPEPSTLLDTYAIQGFPTKIILDPQGKIVKTVVGEDPVFYETLDQLLK